MIFPSRKHNQIFITENTFPEEMATLRNKKKLAALNKENCEEHPGSNLAQNSSVPRSQEDYITKIFEEIEGRVTKKLSQEFSGTENRILGALARLDEFLMKPLIQGHSGTAPETSWDAFRTSQGTNEDNCQSDPHPEAGIFNNQTTQNSGPEDGDDMVTGVTEEIRNRHDSILRDIAKKAKQMVYWPGYLFLELQENELSDGSEEASIAPVGPNWTFCVYFCLAIFMKFPAKILLGYNISHSMFELHVYFFHSCRRRTENSEY